VIDVGASGIVGASGTTADLVPDAPLTIPVDGVQANQLVDTYEQARSEGRTHEAIDILAPRGTPVRAVADGRVAKLFTSRLGGLTVYQFDRRERLAYYYAHLDAYAPELAEGQVLRRGQVLGFVGASGNASADAPHLHFAVFVLGPERHWWEGAPLNPYPLLAAR
jgi:murein DD-endopeptidase MepM/ murein hydrolase activator NlpD